MLGNTLLIGGGQVDLAFAKEYIRKQGFDTVVCADSGLDAADRLALDVDYVMGDFDSVSTKIYQKYHQMQTAFVSYPPEKDATDMQIVLEWAVEQGAEEIHILGATGKRLDHFLGKGTSSNHVEFIDVHYRFVTQDNLCILYKIHG